MWRVYGFLAFGLRDRDVAEDLTQLTFERALRAWPRFDPARASEATWLLTIARNLMIDHGRRDRSDPRAEIDERILPRIEGPEAQFEGVPELDEVLEGLSEREREVISLRFGADLTGRQIAEALGLTLANVQQILSRTLRKLRDELDARGISSGTSG